MYYLLTYVFAICSFLDLSIMKMEKISDYHPVIDALYAAEKYAVNDLVDLCRVFLESNKSEETVCDIMENARFFNTTDLHAKCLKFIFQSPCYARNVFKSPEFIRCSRDGIESLMKDDKLPLEEKIIDQSLKRWAENRCKK